MKNVVKLEHYYSPRELERTVGRFLEHYNDRRLHEALQNVTPADVYYGRQATILSRRERIKQATLKRRKRMNRRAAWDNQPAGKCLVRNGPRGLDYSDDEQTRA